MFHQWESHGSTARVLRPNNERTTAGGTEGETNQQHPLNERPSVTRRVTFDVLKIPAPRGITT